jgi:hypothetical protein
LPLPNPNLNPNPPNPRHPPPPNKDLDQDGDKRLDREDFASFYGVRQMKAVLSGDRSADDVLDELISHLASQGGGGWQGVENGVTLDAWEQYYTNVSNLVDCDLMFTQMVRDAWAKPVAAIRADRDGRADAAQRTREGSAVSGGGGGVAAAAGEGGRCGRGGAQVTAAAAARRQAAAAAETDAYNRVQRRRDWARKASEGVRGGWAHRSIAKTELLKLRKQEKTAKADRRRYLSWAAERLGALRGG